MFRRLFPTGAFLDGQKLGPGGCLATHLSFEAGAGVNGQASRLDGAEDTPGAGDADIAAFDHITGQSSFDDQILCSDPGLDFCRWSDEQQLVGMDFPFESPIHPCVGREVNPSGKNNVGRDLMAKLRFAASRLVVVLLGGRSLRIEWCVRRHEIGARAELSRVGAL